jgi:hypothetical protein
MAIKNHLFSKNEWPIFAAYQRSRLEEEIDSMDGDRLLNTSILDLSNYLADKYKITVPLLQKERIVVDQREAQIDVSSERARYGNERGRPFLVTGTVVEVSVPFEGSGECFEAQPTTFTFSPPSGYVEGDSLIFHIEGVGLTIDQVRSRIQQTLSDITQNLNFLRGDADRFNGNLYSYAHSLIAQRRRKLFTDRNLVSGLGYKLRERTDEAVPDVVPETKRQLAPILPPAGTTPYKPEPVLAAKDFARILDTMQKTARLLSYSPTLLSTMDEASLRSHFLAQLNAHFEAKNPGESFTFEGKSDILIRVEGKNIFTAACILWAGPTKLIESIEQFLNYGNWRDTKAALIIYNRENSFVSMIESLRETIKSHSNVKRELPQLSETVFPYIFAHRGDRNREMLLTVLAFDNPAATL